MYLPTDLPERGKGCHCTYKQNNCNIYRKQDNNPSYNKNECGDDEQYENDVSLVYERDGDFRCSMKKVINDPLF